MTPFPTNQVTKKRFPYSLLLPILNILFITCSASFRAMLTHHPIGTIIRKIPNVLAVLLRGSGSGLIMNLESSALIFANCFYRDLVIIVNKRFVLV